MVKMRSAVWRVAAVLVPLAVGCTTADDDADAPASGDAVEESFKELETKLPRQDLAVKSSTTDADGTVHVRFAQHYLGIPVFEGEVITHVKNGKVTETNALRTIKNLSSTPNITRAEAIASAREAGPTDGSVQILDAKLVVLPSGDHDARDRLSWHVRLLSEGGDDGASQWDTFIDAHNGKLALAFDSLETGQAPTHGRTAWSGPVDLEAELTGSTYTLKDARGNLTFDMLNKTTGTGSVITTTNTESIPVLDAEGNPVLGPDAYPVFNLYGLFGNFNKTLTPRDTAGADASFGLQKTLDYYQQVLGRNGIDGIGTVTRSRVHYGASYENAFWSDSCFCMTYGDGGATLHPLTNLDVVGHEMSHGVMSRTANLTYRAESGGLNESNSDIFGTLVEHWVNSPTDIPDWKIGERLYKANEARSLRHMDNPTLDGKSPACWTSKLRSLDVHYSSGPNNHMFYLLANGGVSACNATTHTGIGLDKAAKIWYRAVTVYMTASTTYAGARVAAIKAATDLHGAGSPEVTAVAAAYSAIKVN